MYCNLCCDKKEVCTGVCSKNRAGAIIQFIEATELVDTDIGEIRTYEFMPTKDKSRLVIGVSVGKDGVTHIASTLGQSVERADKITARGFLDGKKLLDTLKTVGNDSMAESVDAKIRKINRNKAVMNFIKHGTRVTVIIDESGRTETAVVQNSEWVCDKETGKMCGRVITGEVKLTGQPAENKKLNFEDYGNTWWLSSAVDNSITKIVKSNCIKMDRYGMIKPCKFLDNKGNSISVDGTYIYDTNKRFPLVIAVWDGGKIREDVAMDTAIKECDAYKEFLKHKSYIYHHIKMMVPIMFTEENIIRQKREEVLV